MAEAVGEVGGGDGAHGSDDEDGDAADLGGGGCIAQFADYGGDEEGAGVACVYYSHVHYDAGVDFPVREDAFGCFFAQWAVSILCLFSRYVWREEEEEER